jgi:hypothetical protein
MADVTMLVRNAAEVVTPSELGSVFPTADNNQSGNDFRALDFGEYVRASYSKSLPRLNAKTRWYGVRYSGRLIELQTTLDGQSVQKGGGTRGDVTEFTWASRRRLLKLIGSVSWAVVGEKWFVTLSYPDDFPTDCRVAKAHLKAFRKAFERAYGRSAVAVWKMEFQGRGAVHFHLLIPKPDRGVYAWTLQFPGLGDPLAEFRQWCAETWFRVVGSGDVRHLLAGTGVELSTSDCAKYFSYMLKEKGYQNAVPNGETVWVEGRGEVVRPVMTNPGRFWGVWGYKSEFKGVLLTRAEFVALNRTLRAWERSKRFVVEGGHVTLRPGSRKRRRKGDGSNWFLMPPGSGPLIYKFLGVLEEDLSLLL